MKKTEAKEFAVILKQIHEYYDGKVNNLEMWWNALKAYPIAMVRSCLNDHVTDPSTGKFAPKIADVIGRIHSKDGHTGAEEAWAKLHHYLGDESATLVLTAPEHAAFLAADPLSRDKVAARMVFKEVYNRELAAWRERGGMAQHQPILGHDPAQRAEALKKAISEKKLLPSKVDRSLLEVQGHTMLADLTAAAPDFAKRALQDIKDRLHAAAIR